MIARRPVGRSWQNTTCSWPAAQISAGATPSVPSVCSGREVTHGSDVTPAVPDVGASVLTVVVVTHQGPVPPGTAHPARSGLSRGPGGRLDRKGRSGAPHQPVRHREMASRNRSLIRDARRAGWAAVRRSITVRCYLVTVRTR